MASREIKRRIRLLLASAGLLGVFATPAPAQDSQRYQAIALPEGNRSGQTGAAPPKVFILDTREGHLWTWAENETVYQDGQPRIGTVLIYQGRLRPGERPGEILEQHFP